MRYESQDDLKWSAYRYVAGEMTEEERRLFELRLPDDESACDAVEQAVELQEAIRLATPELSIVRRPIGSSWRGQPALWAALAASVLLAVFVGKWASVAFQRFRPASTNNLVSNGNTVATPDSLGSVVESRVSLAWVDLRYHDLATEDVQSQRWAQSTSTAGFDDLLPDMGDTETTPPQWLLTAVASGIKPTKETP